MIAYDERKSNFFGSCGCRVCVKLVYKLLLMEQCYVCVSVMLQVDNEV